MSRFWNSFATFISRLYVRKLRCGERAKANFARYITYICTTTKHQPPGIDDFQLQHNLQLRLFSKFSIALELFALISVLNIVLAQLQFDASAFPLGFSQDAATHQCRSHRHGIAHADMENLGDAQSICLSQLPHRERSPLSFDS